MRGFTRSRQQHIAAASSASCATALKIDLGKKTIATSVRSWPTKTEKSSDTPRDQPRHQDVHNTQLRALAVPTFFFHCTIAVWPSPRKCRSIRCPPLQGSQAQLLPLFISDRSTSHTSPGTSRFKENPVEVFFMGPGSDLALAILNVGQRQRATNNPAHPLCCQRLQSTATPCSCQPQQILRISTGEAPRNLIRANGSSSPPNLRERSNSRLYQAPQNLSVAEPCVSKRRQDQAYQRK